MVDLQETLAPFTQVVAPVEKDCDVRDIVSRAEPLPRRSQRDVDERLVDLGNAGAKDADHPQKLAGNVPFGVLRGDDESRSDPELEALDEAGADKSSEPVIRIQIAAFDHFLVQDRERGLGLWIDADKRRWPQACAPT